MSEVHPKKEGTPNREKEAVSSNIESPDNELHPLVTQQLAKDIWVVLIILRCINALCIRTFFQPDEYYQSLEPAWQIAFGSKSGAWITWEWQHGLRSSLHPALFAAVYYVVDKTLQLMYCFPQFRATILSVLPNLVQALFAATGDYYTWQLAERIYGKGSNVAWAALLMTIFSPWQWFCSTRTFPNCLETTLTIAALYHWPWELTTRPVPPTSKSGQDQESRMTSSALVFRTTSLVKNLSIALLLISLACILRPTNLLIWFPVLMPVGLNLVPGVSQLLGLSETRANSTDYRILVRESLLCGSAILLLSAISDRLYFGEWIFPPNQWLKFNISQDLAVFYGRNDWHYYISQGLPLLLTTYLPFTLISLYNSTFRASATSEPWKPTCGLITTIIVTTIGNLSLISHKEVRFIYPLLPLLHILTAPTISTFFTRTKWITTYPPPFPFTPRIEKLSLPRRKNLLGLLIILNVSIAFYTTRMHQTGVLSVLPYLRHEYEALALSHRGIPLSTPNLTLPPHELKITDYDPNETFTAFLMPCHSTPWRSQLFYAGLKAWALTCEPPLHLAASSEEREEYRDEADRFYDDMGKFLNEEVGGKERPWPRYVVGFEGIEGQLREWYEGRMQGWKVNEKWRARNSHWHDDSRRKGDVVVWEFVDGSRGF